MSKKNSGSMRLDAGLIAEARTASELEHRTPAKQIEYWAMVGRIVSQNLDSSTLRQIMIGRAQVVAETVDAPVPAFDAVLAAVDADTRPPRERAGLDPSQPAYQVSRKYPGYLERVNPDSSVDVGTFSDGAFHVCQSPPDAAASV